MPLPPLKSIGSLGISLMTEGLHRIARRVRAKKQYLRSFTECYETLFAPYREHTLTILELGVGGYKNPNAGGGSLRMWAEFFPNAQIVGLDIAEKRLQLPSNVALHQGSQTDVAFLMDLAATYGSFDIVIDDASHVTEKTIISFECLWPFTRFFYVIEDLHMAKAAGTADYFQHIGANFDTPHMCIMTKDGD